MTDCPQCGEREGLAAARRMVLPGDRRADEITLEVLSCRCGFKALAVTELSRRASLHGAPERIGYRLPPAAVNFIAFLIARCPNAAEEYCACPAHAALNRRDLRNQWNLLHSFAPFASFAVPPAPSQHHQAAFDYAPLAWTRHGPAYRAEVEGRLWELDFSARPDAPPYELAIDGGIAIEFDAWPPFWRAPAD
ncbi:MAG: hypothetical protein KIT16_03205 [Rhodospirillaceae bacterium]|nr:hypothetical protein [Rhodospirillaceae bacterium]